MVRRACSGRCVRIRRRCVRNYHEALLRRVWIRGRIETTTEGWKSPSLLAHCHRKKIFHSLWMTVRRSHKNLKHVFLRSNFQRFTVIAWWIANEHSHRYESTFRFIHALCSWKSHNVKWNDGNSRSSLLGTLLLMHIAWRAPSAPAAGNSEIQSLFSASSFDSALLWRCSRY